MKIMDGSLYENLYDWPEDQKKESISSEPKKMTPRKITEYHKNQVAYINGNFILFYAYLVRDGWFDLKYCLWLLSPNFASNVNFHSPWNQQKSVGFLMISVEMRINSLRFA